MTVDYLARTARDDRNPKAEFSDHRRHLRHGVVVLARVAGVRNQPADGPVFDRKFGHEVISSQRGGGLPASASLFSHLVAVGVAGCVPGVRECEPWRDRMAWGLRALVRT